tara:strand:+ start:283 stop:474 length:192 start_codon:yes stop_codon:yes gene_type:complete
VNKRQKESTSKYLHDISKGLAILCVIGNIVQGKWEILTLFFGFLGTIAFFICAFMLEGGMNHE